MSDKSYRPKKLVWKKITNQRISVAITSFYLLRYEIVKWDSGIWHANITHGDLVGESSTLFSSEQEAKKACQAHYDALWISGGEEV